MRLAQVIILEMLDFNKTLMYYVLAWLVVFSFLKLKSSFTGEWTEVNDEYAHMHILAVFLRYQHTVARGGNERPGLGYKKSLLQGVLRDKSDSCHAGGDSISHSPKDGSPGRHYTQIERARQSSFFAGLKNLSQGEHGIPKEGSAENAIQNLADPLLDDSSLPIKTSDLRKTEAAQFAAALEESKREEDFDGAVNQVALYNYEVFHNLSLGTATFEMVQATSAGIQGWAAAVLDNDDPKTGQEALKATMDTTTEQPKPGRKSRGVEEEELMLQMALLESVGAHPSMLKEIPTPCDENDDDDEEEDSIYQYNDTDSQEAEDSSCCNEGNRSFEEEYVENKAKDGEGQSATRPDDVPVREVFLNSETGMSSNPAKGCCTSTESKTIGKTDRVVEAVQREDQERQRGSIVRSSWQFQALMEHVKGSSGRPVRAAHHQQSLGEEAQKQATTQPDGSNDRNCDDDSWSQLSNGSTSKQSDPIMIGGNDDESVSSRCDNSWHRVEFSSASDDFC
jgi:hypothetical protein